MILSEKLARLYATYRQRLIDGPEGVFCDSSQSPCTPPVPCNEFPGVEFQRPGHAVPFLRQSTISASEPGAYLVADLLKVHRFNDPPDTPEEEQYITGIRHADQTLYASNLFLTLVAEYVITFDDETLELAESVIAMLKRLGTWQPGYEEEPPPNRCSPRPGRAYGYMVRHDAFDGYEESFCDWKTNYEHARFLEPSYDQLGTLNNCGAFAWRILRDADVASDPNCPPAHHARVNALMAAIEERMVATHRYIATNCRYSLRRCDGREVDRQGGWCWMYAYPLARVQASVRAGGVGNYDRYLETFLWRFLPDLIENLVAVILEGLIESLPGLIADTFDMNNAIQEELGEFGDFLDVVLEHFGDILEDILVGALTVLQQTVRAFVTSDIARYIREQLANLPDDPISRGLNDALARSLFKIFSRATIVDPRNELDPRESLLMRFDAGQMLQDLGLPNGVPDEIRFRYRRRLKTPAVTVKVWVPWPPPGHHEEVTVIAAQDYGTLDIDWSIPIPWSQLFQHLMLPVTVPASILGELVFSNTDSARFMTYHFFCANAAADTFTENRIDPIRAANRFDSAFFMALLHRFRGASGGSVMRRLSTLESAPADFPKRSARRGWNQDFRWKRSKRDPGGPGELYNGIDLMVASTVAASRDAARNRDTLIDAIESARRAKEDDNPGQLRLPFQGPYQGPAWTVWNNATSEPGDDRLYFGVEFDRRRPDGGIRLRMSFDDGSQRNIVFSQGEPRRAIAVSPTLTSISVIEVFPGTKGEIRLGI